MPVKMCMRVTVIIGNFSLGKVCHTLVSTASPHLTYLSLPCLRHFLQVCLSRLGLLVNHKICILCLYVERELL
jgi:hypothetical protein